MFSAIARSSKLWLAAVLFCLAASARGDTVLDFQDVLAAMGSDTPFFTPIQTKGFTLASTNPPTGFSAGFEVHGPTSLFYAGEVGVLTFAPATAPDNLITLTQTSGQPFNLVSIDLARYFPFDPAPTVTFTGIKSNGSTVNESFTVTVPVGTAAFQTFDFTGFTDVTSVSWGQPPLADGLNQFSRIDIGATGAPVPEPGSVALLVSLGGVLLGLRAAGRLRRA